MNSVKKVKNIYLSRQREYNDKLKTLRAKSRLYLYGKLLSFAAFCVFIYMALSHDSSLYAICATLMFIAYAALYWVDYVSMERIGLCKKKIEICDNELKYLSGNLTPFDDGERYTDYKHEFSYDLDVFGHSSLFQRINRTITRKGSDRLAGKLTHLCIDREEITATQKAVAELSAMHDWRIKYLTNPYVEDNIDKLGELVKNSTYSKWIVQSALPLVSIAITVITLFGGITGVIPMAPFSIMFSIQFFTTYMVFRTSNKTGAHIGRLHKEFSGYLAILEDIRHADFKSLKLRRLKEELTDGDKSCMTAFRQLSHILNIFDQRNNIIVYILLNGVILYDILLIRRFVRWSDRYLPYVRQWTDSIAELDTLVSLATYTANNPGNTFPQIIDDNSDCVVEATDVFHPFLAAEKAVPNSFKLQKNNIAIVTGANMAGKSTFLRTIGVSYIMACCGLPVCAHTFKFSIVSLFSSMRTTDNLSENISYFNAELIRLEQLINHVKEHRFTLIILDEILKGTNSKDKLEGSVLFLDEISQYNMSAIIATHDLELAKRNANNSSSYKNYCFEIELSENITYSYKIKEGVAQNLNASWLLARILNKNNLSYSR